MWFYSLHRNSFTSEGAANLFDLLKSFPDIETIDLSTNIIDDECMQALGELISANNTLKSVNLSAGWGDTTKITTRGVEILSSYVIGSTVLEELDFNSNSKITEDALEILSEMVLGSSIRSLNVRGTQISKDGKAKLLMLQQIPVEERSIPVRSTTKSAAKSGMSKGF